VIPGIPIPAAQFEQLIAACRDLNQQAGVAPLIELTLKKR
jgi:hypothetical protein